MILSDSEFKYYDGLMWAAMWVLKQPIDLTTQFWREYLHLRKEDFSEKATNDKLSKWDIYILYKRCSQVMELSEEIDFWTVTWLDFYEAKKYVNDLKSIFDIIVSDSIQQTQ